MTMSGFDWLLLAVPGTSMRTRPMRGFAGMAAPLIACLLPEGTRRRRFDLDGTPAGNAPVVPPYPAFPA